MAQATVDLRHLGFTVIQRDRVQRILDEQGPHLNNPLAAQTYFIHSGGLSGAEVEVLSMWMVLRRDRCQEKLQDVQKDHPTGDNAAAWGRLV